MASIRPLTVAETRLVDAAWEEYLSSRRQDVFAAWDKYQKTLADLGVFATLAGYQTAASGDTSSGNRQ